MQKGDLVTLHKREHLLGVEGRHGVHGRAAAGGQQYDVAEAEDVEKGGEAEPALISVEAQVDVPEGDGGVY